MPETGSYVSSAKGSFAGWFGMAIHCVARRMRRALAADADASNIAVVCDGFLRYGSAQAVALTKSGLSVTLYCTERVDEFGGNEKDRALVLARVRDAGVSLVSLPRPRIRKLVAEIRWLHRDVRRRQISAAIVQSHYDPRYATLGLALPVVTILHDPHPHTGDLLSLTASSLRMAVRATTIRTFMRFEELTSHCIIIHSARLGNQVRPLISRLPIGVIPHGADMALAPSSIPRQRRLLIFGRLVAYKGVDTALQATRLLSEKMPDLKLVIAGRGELADHLRQEHNVEFRDKYIHDDEAHALIDSARLVLLPYKDATQSGVGLLAIARGVPCVVSSAGGLPDLVKDVSPSLVVPPNDPRRLAKAISVHIDHDERLRAAIYSHAANRFAWPVAAERLLAEVERLGLPIGSDG
jgi:glycosyltransferase involved in cell wall biosynthesis